MGTMTFLLPAGLGADSARELERACIAGGPDNMPWPTRVQVEAGRLIVRRDVDESGYLVVPWEIEGLGRLIGTTATLIERAEPYNLPVELARGKVNQLRCQAADWQAGGLLVPAGIEEQIRGASSLLARAVMDAAAGPAGQEAQKALAMAYRAAEQLTGVYTGQVFQVRCQRQPRLETALGCRLAAPPPDEAAEAFLQTFDSLCLPFSWSLIEANEGTYRWELQDSLLDWATAQGLALTAGPLLDFSPAQMPDWLWLWERDLTSLHKFISGFVATAVQRYRRRIRRWHLTSASNSASLLSLGEEELLLLTVKVAQLVHEIDPDLELVVGLAQPWGEYMAFEDRSHSPFIFADTLIRSELHLAALDVELAVGIMPRGSYCRDLLDTSRLLDLYALLGVPLRITLAYPSAAGSDPQADPELRAAAGHWHVAFSPEAQADWARSFAALALCKPYVQAVVWAHLADAVGHQFPHCGLLDAAGKPKPALDELRRLREQHLLQRERG